MNIDLGSPILDIAIGLSFVFFLLSLIASAVNEGIAGVLNLRGKTLEQGLSGMLGNVAAAIEFPRRRALKRRCRPPVQVLLFALGVA